jgi:hypothetical protein
MVWASMTTNLPSGSRSFPLALFRSDAIGSSFGPPTLLLPNDLNNQNGDLALLADGSLLASFQEIDRHGTFLSSPRLWVVRSVDGGGAFSPPRLVAEDFIALSPVFGVRRGTSTERDHVYMGWLGTKPARNLYVTSTTDGGLNWAAPLPVLPDPWPETLRLPHSPVLAVDSAGTLGLLWMEPQAHMNETCFIASFTASVDGGLTFLAPVKLADVLSCPNTPTNQIAISPQESPTVARRWPDGGDYYGLVAVPGKGFHAVWSDSHTGTFQLWSTGIRIETTR